MLWSFSVGIDTSTSVDEKDYQVPFAFTGKLNKLTVKVSPNRCPPKKRRQPRRTCARGNKRCRISKHTVEFDWKYDGPGLGKGGTGTLKAVITFLVPDLLLRSLRRDPLRIPIKTALVAVDEVARFLEAVELAGIDYEFGGNIEAAQGLIHLFAVEQWDVEIVPAAQK